MAILKISEAMTAPKMPEMTSAEWAEHDARVTRELAELEQREAERASNSHRAGLIANGFPRRGIEAASDPRGTRAVLMLREWSTAEGQTIAVLSGNPGCGKTVAACVYALARASAGHFACAGEFAASSHYGDDRKRWLAAGVLVVDDIGAERGECDWDLLVNKFYGDKRILIMTTNLDAAAFRKRYGERIVDRLRECGQWLAVQGESLRGKKET